MKEVSLTILFIFALLLPIGGFFIGWRNQKVGEFRTRINHLCYNFSINNPHEQSAYDWCYYKLPTFGQMLYSFRPLKLEAWIDRDVVERLKSGVRPETIKTTL